MSTEFFEKLKKGMDAEAKPEVVLTSTEQISEPEPVKKKTTKKKTTRKKKAEKKPQAEKKIEVKQEPSIKEEKIDSSVFQKEGQLTIDVFETEKDIIIQSAVAGIEPEDLDISIEKDMVSIKGKRERKIEEQTKNFFYQECFWGRFSREVILPSEVDKNKAEASIKNGVLTIKIPKINTANSKRLNINIE